MTDPPAPIRNASHQINLRVIIAGVYAAFMIIFAVVQFGLPGLQGTKSDLLIDWLSVRAVADGRNPYLEVEELADRYGVIIGDIGGSEVGEGPLIHPRPPGALLLMYPLRFVPADRIQVLSLALNGVAALAFLAAVAGATSTRVEWVLLGAPLLMLSHPVISAFEFGTQSIMVAALLTYAVILSSRRDSALAGVLLGLAVTLKLWPGLLLLVLVLRRRTSTTLWAVITSAGLNVIAGVLFGVGPARAWYALSQASSAWLGFHGNGSLPGRLAHAGVPPDLAVLFGVGLIVAVLPALWGGRVGFESAAWGAVAAALLMSPLAWDHYDVALIPAGLLLWKRSGGGSDPVKWLCVGWALFMVGGRFARPLLDFPDQGLAGAITFAERAILLVALLIVSIRARRQHSEPRLDQEPSTLDPDWSLEPAD